MTDLSRRLAMKALAFVSSGIVEPGKLLAEKAEQVTLSQGLPTDLMIYPHKVDIKSPLDWAINHLEDMQNDMDSLLAYENELESFRSMSKAARRVFVRIKRGNDHLQYRIRGRAIDLLRAGKISL